MGILDQDSLDRGASRRVKGMAQAPGTWCGPGATPMIAQSPADSPGMPGQWVEPRPCRRPGPHARADRRPPSRRTPAPTPLVLVVVLGVPCRLAYVRAADPKYVSLPQFGSYRLGHLPPHPHVRSAARRHRQARRHRRLGDPGGGHGQARPEIRRATLRSDLRSSPGLPGQAGRKERAYPQVPRTRARRS